MIKFGSILRQRFISSSLQSPQNGGKFKAERIAIPATMLISLVAGIYFFRDFEHRISSLETSQKDPWDRIEKKIDEKVNENGLLVNEIKEKVEKMEKNMNDMANEIKEKFDDFVKEKSDKTEYKIDDSVPRFNLPFDKRLDILEGKISIYFTFHKMIS